MNRDGHEAVSFFVGTEVEHSPAYGLKTLFVVGTQDPAHIQAQALAHKCDHIYFGANQSFPNNGTANWKAWENMIVPMLKSGQQEGHTYLCTLDLDVAVVEDLLDGPLVEFHNFIPMISVKLPYINQLGYNATLKIDDKDFRATNPGVWCHALHDLQNREVFTDWSKYTQDNVLK